MHGDGQVSEDIEDSSDAFESETVKSLSLEKES